MRVQKAVCDQCGREVPTRESIYCNGISVRVGDEGTHAYLYETDFCSIECMAINIDEVLKQINKRLKDAKKDKPKKE